MPTYDYTLGAFYRITPGSTGIIYCHGTTNRWWLGGDRHFHNVYTSERIPVNLLPMSRDMDFSFAEFSKRTQTWEPRRCGPVELYTKNTGLPKWREGASPAPVLVTVRM